MSSMERGTVVSVEAQFAGSSLTADAAIAAVSLAILDTSDFPEDGGQLQIGTQVVDYAAFEEAEDGTATLTLAAGLTTAALDGDPVFLYPLTAELIAHVSIENEGDTVEARVPYSMRASFPEGVRDYTTAEQVSLRMDRGEFVIDDAYADDQLVDGAQIDPTTTLPPESLTDGVAPDESPIPDGTGLQRQIIAKVDGIANYDPVTYHWHITTDNTTVPSYNGATRVGAGGNTMFVYTELVPGTPLAYDTDYFLGTFATDADLGTAGPGPFSGWSDAVRLNPAASDDIAVGAILAAKIDVVDLMASGIRTSEAGARVELSTEDGFTVFDSTEKTRVSFPTSSDDLKINADLIAQSLTVEGDMSLRGTSHVLERGKALSLAASVSSPLVAPTVVPVLPTLGLAAGAFRPPDNRRGLAWFSSKWWIAYRFISGTGFVTGFNATTGALTGDQFDLPSGMQPDGGLTRITVSGTDRWAVLCTKTSDGTKWVVILSDTGTEITRWSISSLANRITTDGSSLVVAFNEAGNVFSIVAYSTAGSPTAAYAWDGPVSGDPDEIDGIYVGNGDYGAKRYVVAMKNTGRTYVLSLSGSTLTEVSNTGWLLGGSERVSGLIYDGTSFWTASRASDNIMKYGDWNKASGDYGWFRFTYYDADATGGTHETALSPSVRKAISFSTRRRCWQVTSPAIPDLGGTDDPDTLRVYHAQHASVEPANTGYYLQGTSTSTPTVLVTGVVGSGTTAPSSNNFPGAVPAKVTNSAGESLVSGDDYPRQSFNPTVTGNALALTGATIAGYRSKSAGKLRVEVQITLSTTVRTAPYEITLPEALEFRYGVTSECSIRDASASATYPIKAELNDSGKAKIRLRRHPGADAALNDVTDTTPVALATGDVITVVIEGFVD